MNNQTHTNGTYLLYVGTYTGGDSMGIYCYQLDRSTGQLRPMGDYEVDNPSYLAIDSTRNRLFAVNESSVFGGRPGGSVSALAIEPSSGKLTLINQQFSHGGAPCYLTVDRNGRYLLLVNYMGGNIVVLPVDEDGALGEPSDIVTHSGSSQHPTRQEAPHPHSIVLDPENNFAFIPDLGLDKVMQYRFNAEDGRLHPNERPYLKTKPGSGPRHMVFHPTHDNAYVINELNSTITGYSYDPIRGHLRDIQTVSTLPEGYGGTNITADLHLSPNGRFLYGSNRGHDSIAHFAVDQETGQLTLIDITSTEGAKPRGFAIDPTGAFLLAANQDSHSIIIFRIDQGNGKLIPTGHGIHIPSPVCLKFIS